MAVCIMANVRKSVMTKQHPGIRVCALIRQQVDKVDREVVRDGSQSVNGEGRHALSGRAKVKKVQKANVKLLIQIAERKDRFREGFWEL